MLASTKKLLSLPPNVVEYFHSITGLPAGEYFCTNDPVGHKLGSGGGTVWLLEQCWRAQQPDKPFDEWLASDKRILIHAGGQSRRLPAYAPSGKVLTPIPIFRWERGQALNQTLLDLQLPLYERIMDIAPDNMHTMVVSGDVYIRAAMKLPEIPKADVVCFGLWLDSSVASHHGVFYSRHGSLNTLDHMLQKPSEETLANLLHTGYYLTDIGVWLLSDRAVEVLRRRSTDIKGNIDEYDLYSQFGCALGEHPSAPDPEVSALSVAIVPLPGGEFYHFGTSSEMISSMLAIQNLVKDQREIMHLDRKPHPTLFVQNVILHTPLTSANKNVWVENSCVGPRWSYSHDNIITGVPENDWVIDLQPGQCIDIVPIGEDSYALRPYMISDSFAGEDQTTPKFPVVSSDREEMGKILALMLAGKPLPEGLTLLSAEQLSEKANLRRLIEQRTRFRAANWQALARNHAHSVFYQADLEAASKEYAENDIPLPDELSDDAPLMKRIHDAMFRAQVLRKKGLDATDADSRAFTLLREALASASPDSVSAPSLNVQPDQIVWSRSPVRIDLAGGWSDTPPFCLLEGGNVVNVAIELNGQPPLQAYVKPCREPKIVCRSIDLGATEVIETYEQLREFNRVGSPFSIPKAALALAGFHPDFSSTSYPTLKSRLEAFGTGIEITLFSAIPAGSGLGTSSVLASTVLGALNDFCALGWDRNEICLRTVALEQLLTTGGGWQDQFGGIFGGVKLLQTERGFDQNPQIRWLPDSLFTDPGYAPCHLLYYTGLTRTAKHILAEIVRRMFLNQGSQLHLLRMMKSHALDMYEAIQLQDFDKYGRLLRRTWEQNKLLDSGTSTPEVEAITSRIDDLCLGYKLPGAGGGGYLYMVAKDPDAAARIRHILSTTPPNANARFVDMSLSKTGLQITRS